MDDTASVSWGGGSFVFEAHVGAGLEACYKIVRRGQMRGMRAWKHIVVSLECIDKRDEFLTPLIWYLMCKLTTR